MPRPQVGSAPLKRFVGRSVGWQTAIGPRIQEGEGAPTTGAAEDKYLLPIKSPTLIGSAAGTSTVAGLLSALVQITGTASGTSTVTGNIVSLVFVPITGTTTGTSTTSATLSARRPRASRADTVGPPARIQTVQVPTPATAAGEGVYFVSDGTGGLNQGEPYFVPPSSGLPVNLYQKTYVEDLAETLLFGNATGDDQLIVLTNGDAIRSEDSAASVPGRNVVLTPGSIVDSNRGSLVWGLNQASALRGIAGVDLQYGRTTPTHRIKPGNDYAALVGGKDNGFGYFAGSFTSTSTAMLAGYYSIFSNGTDANSVILGGRYHTVGKTSFPMVSQNNVLVGYEHIIDPLGPGPIANCFIQGHGSTLYHDVTDSAVFGTFQLAGGFTETVGLFVSGTGNQADSLITPISDANTIFGRLNSCFSGVGSNAMFGRFCGIGLPSDASMVGGNTCQTYSSHTLIHGRSIELGYNCNYTALFGDELSALYEHPNSISIANSQAFSGVMARSALTVGTTPAYMTIRPDNSSTYLLDLIVVARQTGGTAGTVGDSAMWAIQVCVRAGASVVIVGTPTGTGTPSAFADAGAGAWNVALSVGATFPVPTDPTKYLVITVTGELDKDISWAARVDHSAVT